MFIKAPDLHAPTESNAVNNKASNMHHDDICIPIDKLTDKYEVRLNNIDRRRGLRQKKHEYIDAMGILHK